MPIVLNKFRLGDRSERIAALADEWGCSVTVATARLLDAGLAAVDREQRMTPDAIRRAFGRMGTPGGHNFVDDPKRCTLSLDDSNGDVVGEITMEAIEAAERLIPGQLKPWPIPDSPGKRMFDEAARHAFEILNGYPVRSVPSEFWGGSPTEADQNYAIAKADFDAYRRRLGFPSAACGGWGSGLGIPTIEDIDAIIPTTPEAVAAEEQRQRLEGPTEFPESLRDGSKVLERIKYLEEIGAPLKINFGLQITDATRDALSGKGAFVLPDESCPGCGCEPGDGPTDGCEHPDGCGYYEDQDPRSMGWVGDNGLP